MMKTPKFSLRHIKLTSDKVDQSAMLNYLVGYLSSLVEQEKVTPDEVWTAVIRAERQGLIRRVEANRVG
jgi:hypothetical protein